MATSGYAQIIGKDTKNNKKIVRDNFPLPVIDDILDDIEQSQVFSTLNLKNEFFHVEIDEDSKKNYFICYK